MIRDALALALVLAACGHDDATLANAAPPAAPVAAPDRIVGGIPHGGSITTIAVTEQADAAVTSDTIGEVRLWPSLDGKREPIPVAAQQAVELAISHARAELLVAILDEAHAVRLLRLGRDGSVRGRAQLPGDVTYEQVIAIEGGVLVRRGDQSIEQFDAAGVSRGRLVADPGERIAMIATRHGSAIALIATEEAAGAKLLRWIVAGDELRWGTKVSLREPISTRALALSPNHQRIAALDLSGSTLRAYDLAPLPKRIDGPSVSLGSGTFGFTDDDHVAVASSTVQWWTVSTSFDPWASGPTSPSPQQMTLPPPAEGGDIADGVAVTGIAAALAVTDVKATRYLGWAELATGGVASAGDQLAVSSNPTHLTWLDKDLGAVRSTELKDVVPDANYVFAVDGRHVLVERNGSGQMAIELIDLEHPQAKVAVGTFKSLDLVSYDARAGVFVVGDERLVHRYAIDAEHMSVTELRVIHPKVQLSTVWLTDPARADGVVAIGLGWDDEEQRLESFTGPKGHASSIRPARSKVFAGQVLAVDATGTIYAKDAAKPASVIARRGGKRLFELGPPMVDSIAVSRDASHFVAIGSNTVTMYDAAGSSVWRQAMWQPVTITYTSDDRRLVIRTGGGLLMLDAATGERISAVCSWEFGLHETVPAVNVFGQPPVCEDTGR